MMFSRRLLGFCSAAFGFFVAQVTFAQPQPSPTPPDEDDVEIGAPAAPKAEGAPTPAALTTPGPTLEELGLELARLKARIEELEAAAKAPPTVKPSEPSGSKGPGAFFESILGVTAIDLTSYLQAQYEWHEDSQDQLLQGGSPLNQDRFLLRRGRIRLDAAWEWTSLALELDGNTVRGPSFGVRRAEASVFWRGPWGPKPSDLEGIRGHGGPPPLIRFTAGITEIPFGDELTRSARERVFMERSAGSLAFFPGEPDVGARLSGGASYFRYSLAVLNGEPLDERGNAAFRDRNAAKDFVGRLGVDIPAASNAVRFIGGVSALWGKGFHAGTDGTKDDIQWNDINENGTIDPGELVGAPGGAPTPSANFTRWAFGADLRLSIDTLIGRTVVFGEAALGENMDRGFFVADPIFTGIDVREMTLSVGAVQELSEYAFVGLRVDLYDPNADFFDTRGGELVPTSQVVRTISPVVGGGFPNQWRAVLQYDNVHDGLARDPAGLPADLANDRFTARLQVSL